MIPRRNWMAGTRCLSRLRASSKGSVASLWVSKPREAKKSSLGRRTRSGSTTRRTGALRNVRTMSASAKP
uniref:Uncharacterized protein n=1 Tax=Triticum urartu TaxID=4572 RepID=A0A8R7K1I8_TRIUA